MSEAQQRCPIHDIVLIERFDEVSRPGLAIPTGERYCWKCEKESH